MLVLTLRDADWPKLCSINKWEPFTHFSFSSSVGKLQISSRGSSKFMVGHVLTLWFINHFHWWWCFWNYRGFFCQFQLVRNILHLVLQYHFTATLFFFSLLSVFLTTESHKGHQFLFIHACSVNYTWRDLKITSSFVQVISVSAVNLKSPIKKK